MLSHCVGLGMGNTLGSSELSFGEGGGGYIHCFKKSWGPQLQRYISNISMATVRVKEKSSNVVLTLFFSLMMYYSNCSATSGLWDVK